MAELTEEQRQAQEIKDIKDNSPFALPDDPSSSGWSTAQIKEKHWMALVIDEINLFSYNAPAHCKTKLISLNFKRS